ncbi:MAG: C25 family cysteine peptidase [Caldilineaceae bacterium]
MSGAPRAIAPKVGRGAIYDAFNYGRPSAEAIRDFLALRLCELAQARFHPRAVAGDGPTTRGYLADSVVPTYIPFLASVDPDLGETVADNRYAAIRGDDATPDLYVGASRPPRLPTSAMVNKTIAYETQQRGRLAAAHPLRHRQPGGRRRRLLQLLRCRGRRHGGDAGGVQPLVPETFSKERLYLGMTCPDEKPAYHLPHRGHRRHEPGCALVSYIGHGVKEYWAEEQILTQAALAD